MTALYASSTSINDWLSSIDSKALGLPSNTSDQIFENVSGKVSVCWEVTSLDVRISLIDCLPSINDDEFIEEPYFAVTVLNTHDNPNEYEPPNSEVEGEIDEITGNLSLF